MLEEKLKGKESIERRPEGWREPNGRVVMNTAIIEPRIREEHRKGGKSREKTGRIR